ncbi:hypothetical protein WK95_15225 [Burkholderia ubonensis]|uniref:Uncharacterized protein n=1 Tax=Burkholderia ubonensis TaxID=101571 RepID=A0AAW3NC48_9BURK|nr:hypothetical protein WK53_32585 [Burkholderia ubonensis]KVW41000.1 hypothetical protein WK95_15225 [Burkholderia ubonensis]
MRHVPAHLFVEFGAVVQVQAFQQIECRAGVAFHGIGVIAAQKAIHQLIDRPITVVLIVISPFQERALGDLRILARRRTLISD